MPNPLYGIPFGEKLAPTGSATPIVDGLTTSRYLVVKSLSSNLGDLLITSSSGKGTGQLRLKAGEASVELDLNHDNSSLLVQSTANGTSICFIGKGPQVP
jgi:hypothetical protein